MQQQIPKRLVCCPPFQSSLRGIVHIFSSQHFVIFQNFVQITDAEYLPSTAKHFISVFSYKKEEGQEKSTL